MDEDPFAAPTSQPNPPSVAGTAGADGAQTPGLPPAPRAGVGEPLDDDVWGGGESTAPALPPAPGPSLPPAPHDAAPAAAAPDDDPFGVGAQAPAVPAAPAAPLPTRYQSEDPIDRAEEQATRLLDDPGNPALHGYPPEILMLADAWVALRPGPRPVVVVLYDDSVRGSDRMAADVLPVLAAHQRQIDIIAINRARGATLDEYERQVVKKLVGDGDDVPVLVVQTKDRESLLVRFAPFPAGDLDRVLTPGGSSAPRTGADHAPAGPELPPLGAEASPAPSPPGIPSDLGEGAPPTGRPGDPLGPPRAGGEGRGPREGAPPPRADDPELETPKRSPCTPRR